MFQPGRRKKFGDVRTNPFTTGPMIASHIRQAVRSLRRDRGFTLATIATLGLGMGATLAVFTIIEAVLLRPLPYRAAERIVVLNHHDARTGITKDYVALGDVVDIAARSRSFDAIGTFGQMETTVNGMGDPFRVSALVVTSGAAEALDAKPMLGRGFTAEDSRQGAGPVAIVGNTLWRERFGADPAVIGRSVRAGQQDWTIIGVAEPGWRFPPNADTDLILSQVMPAQAPAERRNWTMALARLKPGVSVEAGGAEVAAIARQLEAEFPATNQASQYLVLPLRDALVGNTKKALVLLFAAVGVLMLIAWANVANLLFARSLGRQRDMAVRVALGASRWRVAAHAFAETAVIALTGALVGLFIAQWGARALVLLVPGTVNVPGLDVVRLNFTVVAFAFCLTVVATLVFGGVTASRARFDGLSAVLGSGVRSSFGIAAQRTLSSIVCAEIAFAVLLLFGAGLVLRSFAALLAVDPGFVPDHVARLSVSLPADRYPSPDARKAVFDRMFDALRSVPGVEAIGAAAITPLTGNHWTHPLVLPQAPLAEGERAPDVGWQVASSGYFKALKIPLISGRLFDETDNPQSRPVVIVSDALVRRYFPNEEAVGQLVRQGDGTAEIVGVVGSIRRAALAEEPSADMYLPFEQSASPQTTLFVRTSGDPGAVQPAIQRAIRGIEPGVLLDDSGTLEAVAGSSLAIPRLLLNLLMVFAGVALVLATIGIYGVTAYSVEQRTKEIGTRIALGAPRGDVYRLILGRGAMIWLIGAAVGLVAALFASRLLTSVLYATSPADPLVLTAVPLALLLVTLGACYIPARRAALVDPKTSLSES